MKNAISQVVNNPSFKDALALACAALASCTAPVATASESYTAHVGQYVSDTHYTPTVELNTVSIKNADSITNTDSSLNSSSTLQIASNSTADIIERHCISYSNASRMMMHKYQNGDTIPEMIKWVERTGEEVEPNLALRAEVNKLYKGIIYEVGKTPRFSSEKYKNTAITNFSDRMMMKCIAEKTKEFG